MLLTHPSFQLFSAPLTDVVLQGIFQKVVLPNINEDELFQKTKFRISSGSLPVGLRWTTHPEYGFPRQPFKVYRRAPSYTQEDIFNFIQNGNESVAVSRQFNIPEELYLMAVSCTVAPGQSLILTPVGRENNLMKAKQIKLESSGTVLFKAPFMIGLKCEGMGAVNQITGVRMDSIIKKNDWQLIQQVGFPLASGEVGGQGYNGDSQGFLPGLTDAKTAALLRLKLGEWLFTPPPSVSATDPLSSNINWVHPKAEPYLQYLNQDSLNMINRCLTNSDDFSFSRTKRQVMYQITRTIPGIHQTGSNNPSQTARAVIQVVKNTLLSVSHESPASLGLGFGTYDFPVFNEKNVASGTYKLLMKSSRMVSTPNFLSMDYMVTAEYTIRPFQEFELPFLDDLSKRISFAALSDDRSLPVTPEQLESIGIQYNRPETRDAAYTQSVKLRWPASNVPHGYGIVANYTSGSDSKVLNDAYKFQQDTYQNIFTTTPEVNGIEQDDADINKYVLTLSEEPVPIYGNKIHKYFVGGWDVFGRWSAWRKNNFNVLAVKVQQPGIMAINLTLRPDIDMYSLNPAQLAVPCQFEIEFGWDWIDRSPSKIQIAGKFFDPATNNPPDGAPLYFSLQPGDISTSIIEINFPLNDPTALPEIAEPYEIYIIAANSPTSPGNTSVGSSDVPANNLVRYKLIIPNITCSFPGTSPHKVAFAAYIRGLERVRPSSDWSDWNPWDIPFDTVNRKKINYIAKMDDPRPPAVVNLPATVLFTALPDATKIARGILSWPGVTNAYSYQVWEASETAIRSILDKMLRLEFPDDPSKQLLPQSTSHTGRATQLRDLLAQEKYREPCQKFFSKTNTEPIFSNSYELEIPGSSEVMNLYQVSSVNSSNIEGSKSNVIFFAVPRVVKPSPPLLQVRKYKKRLDSDPPGEGIQVKVANTIGEEPLGYQLFRVRKYLNSKDIGTKGPAIYPHEDLRWEPASIDMLDGTSFNAKKINDLYLTRSWKPLVYQAVSIGANDPDRGLLSGMSEPSTNELIYFPPALPPTLLSFGLPVSNTFSSRFELDTSAPFVAPELKNTHIEIYELDDQNQRTLIGSFYSDHIKEENIPLELAVNSSEADLLPTINYYPTDVLSGITRFGVCVKGNSVKLIVRVSDPLGRFTETMVTS